MSVPAGLNVGHRRRGAAADAARWLRPTLFGLVLGLVQAPGWRPDPFHALRDRATNPRSFFSVTTILLLWRGLRAWFQPACLTVDPMQALEG